MRHLLRPPGIDQVIARRSPGAERDAAVFVDVDSPVSPLEALDAVDAGFMDVLAVVAGVLSGFGGEHVPGSRSHRGSTGAGGPSVVPFFPVSPAYKS